MSDNTSDLPGFYRDPKTGKYFRENSGGISNPSLDKLKNERKIQLIQSGKYDIKPSRSLNIVNYLKDRNLGSMPVLQAEREYFRIASHQKCLKEEVCLDDLQRYCIKSVELIKCSEKSLFGVWNLGNSNRYRCVIGEKYFDSQFRSEMTFKNTKNYIVDMCEGEDGRLVYIYNHPFTGRGSAEILITSDGRNLYLTPNYFRPGQMSPYYCCSSTRNCSRLIIGADGYVININALVIEGKILTRGRVHCVSLHESSPIMVTGIHTGEMLLYDLRQRNFQGHAKVSSRCLNDSCFLDSNQVIFAGLDNKLCSVDLRMHRIVSEYFEHNASFGKKRPISVANGLVCTSSADNVVLLWNSSGGLPVNKIKPDNLSYEIRGWIQSHGDATHLYLCEGPYKRAYKLGF